MMRRAAVVAVLAILAGCGGDSSSGSSAPVLAKLFILDGKGATLTSLPAGSKVMIDGEEIPLENVQLLAGPPRSVARGRAAGGSNLTLYVPGYGGFDDPAADPIAGVIVQLIKRDLLDGLFIFAPTPGRVLVGDPAIPAGSRSLCVQGMSKANGAGALRFDVVLAVDMSGSTLRDSGIDLDGDLLNESVLAVECESLRRYIDALRGAVKIAVIAFSNDVIVKQGLTEDKAAAKAALDDIEAAGSVGGTDYQKALLAAETLLTTDPNRTVLTVTLEDALGEEVEQTVNAPRVVIFCSDGVPTLPNAPGGTQELADRMASLDAAREVVDSQIVVNTVAFGAEAAISKLTTLPGVAAITGGVYIEGPDFLDLSADPNIFGFSDVIGVEVWNATLESPGVAAFSPDGVFQKTVPWTFGDNDIHVRLVTRHAALSVETAFNVRVVLPQDAGVDAILLTGVLPPLTDNTLRTPDGKPIGGSSLRQLFINGPTAVFTDLVEYKGMETFAMLGAGSVTIQVVSKFSDFKSDFGFVEYDPLSPALTVRDLLSGANVVRLANSGDWSSTKKFEQYAPDQAATTFTVSMTAGKHYAFWAIPNGTLADYLALKPTRAPLISVSRYNPIGADHFLSYLSKLGRKSTAHGRSMVFCLEDIATIDQSDRDFNDLVFEILIPPSLFEPEFASPRCP
ncbi:MAG TPA: VWA domain-containing protein [Planctomycetota bacterium]